MYIIIIGCGKVGSELARLLTDAGHNVVAIDKDANAFLRLGADFNGVTMVGNGFDVDLLKEAGIEQADACCTVTDSDNVNIMAGQVAKKIFRTPKVITRVNDAQYVNFYKELGIEMVSSISLIAALIRDKILESRFSGFLLEDRRLAIMEIEANDKITGKRVEELTLPGALLIAAIVKKKKGPFIPGPKDKVEQGDLLIGIVKTEGLADIKKALGL